MELLLSEAPLNLSLELRCQYGKKKSSERTEITAVFPYLEDSIRLLYATTINKDTVQSSDI